MADRSRPGLDTAATRNIAGGSDHRPRALGDSDVAMRHSQTWETSATQTCPTKVKSTKSQEDTYRRTELNGMSGGRKGENDHALSTAMFLSWEMGLLKSFAAF
ncbi:hypothetical protein NEOLEDRAFT_1171990 [Neolentinus lepideus HHB14362 ss-1]|uniref:Uncharacterized protein n=1 Tax=Neolentinus lepideus HHB14362 ss-1 TaxID=1314782 RepID=A0A165PSI4_9AGAM|nr:hypothetical protein NEOLEDRAFT_1171990 [Neolentinus lepideus HHB14362 ss-1]